MICYCDMTFCPFHGDCAKASTCPRPLTDEVREKAKAADLPIAQYVEQPRCHVKI